MRLYLKREADTHGLIKKTTTFRVKSQLQCSEEEKHAIVTLGIDSFIAVDRYEYDKVEFGSAVGPWVEQGITLPKETLLEARQLEHDLHDQAQKINDMVKTFIDDGAQVEEEQTIEL